MTVLKIGAFGIEPKLGRLCLLLWFSPPFLFVVWTIPLPYSCELRYDDYSLCTFPFGLRSGLASALSVKRSLNLHHANHKFPYERPIYFKSSALPLSYTPDFGKILSKNPSPFEQWYLT